MKFFQLLLITVSLLFITKIGYSQTVINYQTWSGASGCNIFATPTSVPATVNGTNSNILHQTSIGQPTYSRTNSAVELDCDINANTSATEGTSYLIPFNFQIGYSYTITINAACINSGTTTGAYLTLTANSGGNGQNSLCTGTQTISPTISGNLTTSNSIANTNFNNYTYTYNPFSVAQSFLCIAAIPPPNSGLQSIFVRSITIKGTPPTPTFTLSPTSLTKVCGTALTQTFTVNNVYNSTGVTGYTWNLGANNGWSFSGSPAPSTITTPTNTLTLTANSCVGSLSNVSATAIIGTTGYNTNAVSTTITAPTLSINGPTTVCSASTYSINNLPCNATVAWSVSNPNLATLNTQNSQATITPVTNTNGAVTLTANVSGSTCSAAMQLQQVINLGYPYLTGGTYVNTFDNSTNSMGFYPAITNPACTGYYINTTMGITGATSVVWTKLSSTNTVNFTQTGNDIRFYLYAPNQYVLFQLTAGNSCGSSSQQYKWLSSDCGGVCNSFAISPNPAKTSINISTPNITAPCSVAVASLSAANTSSSTRSTSSTREITIGEVKVFDNAKNLKRDIKVGNNREVSISTTGLIPGVYFVEIISNNNHSETHTVIVN